MAELTDLYQEAILDHYRKPRNFRRIEHPNRQADGFNPLCGDKVSIYLKIEEETIQDISFTGSGCAISIASASMMTESLKGKTEAEARTIHESFLLLLTSRSETHSDSNFMGNLQLFSSVRDFPVRSKCATLAWQTLRAALEQRQENISTE